MSRSATRLILVLACGVALLAGCTYVPNWFKEDGPSTSMAWDSPSAADIRSRTQPAPQRHRDTAQVTVSPSRGQVYHWPVYFEDPFVDKGHGRTDETNPHDVYRAGWEDYVALPYSPARYIANLVLLPASAIVTPPITVQESDGKVSRQLLGYDHDAESVGYIWTDEKDLHPIVADRVRADEGKQTQTSEAAPAEKTEAKPAAPAEPAK